MSSLKTWVGMSMTVGASNAPSIHRGWDERITCPATPLKNTAAAAMLERERSRCSVGCGTRTRSCEEGPALCVCGLWKLEARISLEAPLRRKKCKGKFKRIINSGGTVNQTWMLANSDPSLEYFSLK
ncbi:unnamed protein product [Allacma fusca]|uniref:Uncharacterized protein n=1 Tax=Allacma fusca TaxID=39272 RepID=A0A8J2L3P4_9HEXA|nr:unnamed protein product [Allacma fusca]